MQSQLVRKSCFASSEVCTSPSNAALVCWWPMKQAHTPSWQPIVTAVPAPSVALQPPNPPAAKHFTFWHALGVGVVPPSGVTGGVVVPLSGVAGVDCGCDGLGFSVDVEVVSPEPFLVPVEVGVRSWGVGDERRSETLPASEQALTRTAEPTSMADNKTRMSSCKSKRDAADRSPPAYPNHAI